MRASQTFTVLSLLPLTMRLPSGLIATLMKKIIEGSLPRTARAVGWAGSLIVRNATPIQASVPPLAIVAALATSAITGIVFGMLPALRASRLDPVAALRYE